MDDVVEVFGNDVCEGAVYDASGDVDDEAEEVEVELDVINPDDANVVLDEAVVADNVYVAVIVVANLLDDEVVEVNVVDVLDDVAVVVNLIDVTVEKRCA